MFRFRAAALLAACLALPAFGQNTVKVGVIAEFSGPFAAYGQQIEAGMARRSLVAETTGELDGSPRRRRRGSSRASSTAGGSSWGWPKRRGRCTG